MGSKAKAMPRAKRCGYRLHETEQRAARHLRVVVGIAAFRKAYRAFFERRGLSRRGFADDMDAICQ